MALIKVNERDSSWYYRQRVSGQLAVLVPGVATFGPYEPVYLTSDNFTQVLGTSSVDSRDLSYNMAASFIAAGSDVLFWRIPLEGAKASSHVINGKTLETEVLSSIEVRAKYEGSFGNTLQYKCYRAGSSASTKSPNYRFLVYSGSSVVETLIVNFEDLDSEYYYETVNQSSKYVEFLVSENSPEMTFNAEIDLKTSQKEYQITLPTKDIKKDSVSVTFNPELADSNTATVSVVDNTLTITLSSNPNSAVQKQGVVVKYVALQGSVSDVYDNLETQDFVHLTDGSDGIYSKTTVTDSIILDSDCREVLNALTDPLQYSFNLMVDGGYNDYLRYVRGVNVTSKSIKTTVEDLGESNGTKTTKLITINLGPKIDKTADYEVSLTKADGSEINDDSELDNSDSSLTWTKVEYSVPKIGERDNKECALIDYLESEGKDSYVSVIFKGNKTSEFDRISQIDDLYISVAEKRGLAIYLVDGSRSWSPEEFFNYTDLPSSSGSSEDKVKLESSAGFNTSYAAAYGPYVSAQLASNGVTRILPGSYALITSWSQSIASGVPMYYAPAGVKRTQLSLVNATVPYTVDSAINELWQSQDETITDGHKINPIMNLRQYGYVIYGNSTLLKNRADGATSMLQSMSTRVLANLIKQRAFDISLSLQFDQIDSDLFSQFKVLLTTYMDTLKYKGALYDYLIVADYSEMTLDDLNSRTVPVTIKISPNPAAENFVINLEISQAGVSFSDNQESTLSAEG